MAWKITKKLPVGKLSSRSHPHGVLPHAEHIRGIEEWKNNRHMHPGFILRREGEIALIRRHLRGMFPGYFTSINTIKHALACHESNSADWVEFKHSLESDRRAKLRNTQEWRRELSGRKLQRQLASLQREEMTSRTKDYLHRLMAMIGIPSASEAQMSQVIH